MKIAQGPRPWSIRLFAFIICALGLSDLIIGLSDIDTQIAALTYDLPSIPWSRDLAIVWISALFTIVLIPVAAIWFRASKIARALVTIAAIPSLVAVLAFAHLAITSNEYGWLVLFNAVMILVAVASLYTNSASTWFNDTCNAREEVFE